MSQSLGDTRGTDYSVVLTVGSFFPCIYYEFYCDTHLQILYLSLIVLVGLGELLPTSYLTYN